VLSSVFTAGFREAATLLHLKAACLSNANDFDLVVHYSLPPSDVN
jgi:hypothetical protein